MLNRLQRMTLAMPGLHYHRKDAAGERSSSNSSSSGGDKRSRDTLARNTPKDTTGGAANTEGSSSSGGSGNGDKGLAQSIRDYASSTSYTNLRQLASEAAIEENTQVQNPSVSGTRVVDAYSRQYTNDAQQQMGANIVGAMNAIAGQVANQAVGLNDATDDSGLNASEVEGIRSVAAQRVSENNTITGNSLADKAIDVGLSIGGLGQVGGLVTASIRNANLADSGYFEGSTAEAPTSNDRKGDTVTTTTLDSGVNTDSGDTSDNSSGDSSGSSSNTSSGFQAGGVGLSANSLSGRAANFAGSIAIIPNRYSRGRIR